jgi:ribosome biogenesis GTPase
MIYERDNYISRKSPKQKGASFRGERLEQVVASNIENFFVIASASEPDFNNKVIDRFIVIGESSKPRAVYIILNKTDLRLDDEIKYYIDLYSRIGYRVISASVKNGYGIDEISRAMEGKINFFWGQSGVGKSSILNAVFPHLNFKVADVSAFSSKGRHTTVTSSMIKAKENTFIIDTPGIREIAPFGIRKEDLFHYFIEFPLFSGGCRFNTCTHFHEPGCAVLSAVEEGKISPERYDSYLRILETVEEDIVF